MTVALRLAEAERRALGAAAPILYTRVIAKAVAGGTAPALSMAFDPAYRQAVEHLYPRPAQPRVVYEYEHAQRAALIEMERAPVIDRARGLGFAAGDDEIGGWAKKCAAEGLALLHRKLDGLFSLADEEQSIYAVARNLCNRYGVTLPDCPEKVVLPDGSIGYKSRRTPVTVARRVTREKWWRGQGKKIVALRVEAAAIRAGDIGRTGQLFCTDTALYRRRSRQARNDQLMQTVTLTNELGDTMTLAELAAASTANPELRRNELMTRIRGLEEIADLRGDRAYFITLTAPSRFHCAPLAGKKNKNYDGSTPKEAQDWHLLAWARVRAALAKLGIRLYGMRVVEPHGDGCPHWHLLTFVSKEYGTAKKIRAEFFKQWLHADTPDEAGALKARVKVVQVDKRKGSAVAYVAKYLAKNVDGHQLEIAMDRGDDGKLASNGEKPRTAAERIRAWASAHGIRQFQFFGDAAVTWWREYRRLREATADEVLEAPRPAANDGEYAAYLHLVGGVAVPRKQRPIETWRELMADDCGAIKLNAYGEEAAPAIRGLQRTDDSAIRVLTRVHTWTRSTEIADSDDRTQLAAAARDLDEKIEAAYSRAGVDQAPWTRVTNCNQLGGPAGPELGRFAPEAGPPDGPPAERSRRMIEK